MTGAVKHAENAVKARQELAAVKAQASELIGGLVALVKGMYLFADGLEAMRFDGKPVGDVVAELIAADPATYDAAIDSAIADAESICWFATRNMEPKP